MAAPSSTADQITDVTSGADENYITHEKGIL